MLVKRNSTQLARRVRKHQIVTDKRICRIGNLNYGLKGLFPERSFGFGPKGATPYAERDWGDHLHRIRQHVRRWHYAIHPATPSSATVQQHPKQMFQAGTDPSMRLFLSRGITAAKV